MLNIFNRNRTKYADSGWSSENDTFWTKIAKRLNYFMNPDHQWTDYDSWNENSTLNKVSSFLKNTGESVAGALSGLNVSDQLQSFVNSQTGAHLTGSQIEANEMQMQNVEDQYQRQVSGMKQAGLNPALMYDSGASTSAPTVQGSQGTASMSELMQAMLLKKQSALLDAQTRNTDADTNKKAAETDYQKLVNDYFPGMKSVELDKILSEIGLNEQSIQKMKSEVDTLKLDQELKRIEKVTKQAEADESSAYYKARREFEQANTDKVKAEKAEILVREAIEVIEKNYMKMYGFKMSSSSILAIAAALDHLLPGFWDTSTSRLPFDTAKIKESLKRSLNKVGDFFADGIGR